MKESKIQEATVSLLAANGFLTKLIEYRGTRDCPDCQVFALDCPGRVAYLELKTKKGKRSPGQINEAELYRIWGHDIGVPRSADEALAHVRKVFYNGETKEINIRRNSQKTRASNDNHVPDAN